MYLAIISALNVGVTTLFSLIVSRLVLVYLGSDYNGLNAIVTQFVTVITLVEGGFTTASLVMLFKPYQEKDYGTVNQLLSETATKFYRIGIFALIIGVVAAVAYSFIINTKIPLLIVATVLIIGLCGSVFNLSVITKYRLIFQAAQDEYIFSFLLLCSNIISHGLLILALIKTKNIIVVRGFHLLGTCLLGIAARAVFKKRYPGIDFSCWDKKPRINGTKDVLVGKVVGVIHSSSTVIFISLFSSVAVASVYAVYQAVFNMVSSVVNILISSPQNALGQVLQENNEQNSKRIVLEFEYIVILVLTVLFIPLFVSLIPFVKIYTAGINDVEYVNYTLAIMLVISSYFQLLHIPSGLAIYMAGEFKVAKKIQIIALGILLVSNIALGYFFSMYGVLFGIMLCNIALAVMEIGYVHFKMFKNAFGEFLIRWLPNLAAMVLLILVLRPLGEKYATNYFSLVIVAAAVAAVCGILLLAYNFVILKKPTKQLLLRVKGIFLKKI